MPELTREQILEERRRYYHLTYIKFEIIKDLLHREMAYLSFKDEEKKKAVRYLISFNLSYFDSHAKWFNFFDSRINIFKSVAVLKNVPVFSYNLGIRKEEEKYQEFNKNYETYIQGYDMFFDIDGKENFQKAFEDAKILKKLLEDAKVPFYILNSSKKGFHIHIPAEFMPNMEIKKLLRLINDVQYNIAGIYELSSIDLSIGDSKRLCKALYSYSCDGVICLPLSDLQFANFSPELVEMKFVLNNVPIKNRGNLLRTYGLDEETLKKNVVNFLNEYK